MVSVPSAGLNTGVAMSESAGKLSGDYGGPIVLPLALAGRATRVA
jgi:hypothetical protein